jgi:hypothetical protein
VEHWKSTLPISGELTVGMIQSATTWNAVSTLVLCEIFRTSMSKKHKINRHGFPIILTEAKRPDPVRSVADGEVDIIPQYKLPISKCASCRYGVNKYFFCISNSAQCKKLCISMYWPYRELSKRMDQLVRPFLLS